MQCASAYQNSEYFFIHSDSQTTVGVWISCEPFTKLPATVSDLELGLTVLSALNASKATVPHPTDWKSLPDPLLDLAGVRSWKKFAVGTQAVGVTRDAGRMSFTPSKNKPDEGFFWLPEKTVDIADTSDAEHVTRALKQTFAACE